MKGFHMPQVPQGACDDVSRGDGSSSRVHVPSFWRSVKPLPVAQYGHERPVKAHVYVGDEYWSLNFENFDVEFTVRVSEEGVDALIGELLAAREQFRMERDAKALMVEALGSLVADSEDDIPW